MLRLLGQSEYGLFSLVASVVAYLGILNFGLGSAYMRYYSRYQVAGDRESISMLNGLFLILFSLISAIALVAGVFLVHYTEFIFGTHLTDQELSKARILLFILVINLAVSFLGIVFTSYITAHEQFFFQRFLQIIRAIANPFVVLPVLILGYGSIGLVIATSLLNIAIEIVNAVFCFRKLKMEFSFKKFDFKLMKEIVTFSLFLFMNLIIDQINWNVDKFLLGRFHGTVSVAIYGLASQLNLYYLSISTAISSVFIPRVHRLVAGSNSSENLTDLFTRIGRVQFIVLSLISTGLIFFGRPFIELWAGNNYLGSYPIVMLLIIPVTVPLIQNIGIEIQYAKNMHKFRSCIYSFIALINVGMTIPLAKMYGGIGAAIGTAVALIIGNGFMMNWYYHTIVGLDMKFFWKQILHFIPSLVMPIMVGIVISRSLNLYSLKYFLLSGFGYVIIFCLSMWVCGLNQYEKDLISKPIGSVLNRVSTKKEL